MNYQKKHHRSYYKGIKKYWETSLEIIFDEPKKILTNYNTSYKSKFISNRIFNHGSANELYKKFFENNKNENLTLKHLNNFTNEKKCPCIFTAVNVVEKYAEIKENYVSVIVTAGVKTNAISAGKDLITDEKPGTINIIIMVDKQLTENAELQLYMITTEAKSGALYDLNIKSSYSDNLATGTGTDTLVIISNNNENNQEHYCGGHSDIGVLVTKLVRKAVKQALYNHLN